MSKTPLVIIGASGTGRSAIDIIAAINRTNESIELVGVIDDSPSSDNLARLHRQGVPYLGPIENWLAHAPAGYGFNVAIAWPDTRRQVADRFERAGHQAQSLIHPSAILGSRVNIGPGSLVFGGVHISTNAQLGAHTLVHANATIGHEAILQDCVSVHPGASIAGDTHVQPCVLIGSGAVVLQGLSIGHRTIIGAAALVTKNVPSGVTVKGVPGRWDFNPTSRNSRSIPATKTDDKKGQTS